MSLAIQSAFIRTFHEGAVTPSARLTAEQWLGLLTAERDALVECRRCHAWNEPHLAFCPSCKDSKPAVVGIQRQFQPAAGRRARAWTWRGGLAKAACVAGAVVALFLAARWAARAPRSAGTDGPLVLTATPRPGTPPPSRAASSTPRPGTPRPSPVVVSLAPPRVTPQPGRDTPPLFDTGIPFPRPSKSTPRPVTPQPSYTASPSQNFDPDAVLDSFVNGTPSHAASPSPRPVTPQPNPATVSTTLPRVTPQPSVNIPSTIVVPTPVPAVPRRIPAIVSPTPPPATPPRVFVLPTPTPTPLDLPYPAVRVAALQLSTDQSFSSRLDTPSPVGNNQSAKGKSAPAPTPRGTATSVKLLIKTGGEIYRDIWIMLGTLEPVMNLRLTF